VLEVAKKMGVEVEERKVSVEEIITAAKNGTLEDAFGAGTAATIAQIAIIGYKDERLELPPLEGRIISNKIKAYMDDMKAGRIDDEFGWNFKV
jgi:branched-chain amino acid aminotransferase